VLLQLISRPKRDHDEPPKRRLHCQAQITYSVKIFVEFISRLDWRRVIYSTFADPQYCSRLVVCSMG